MSDRGDLRIEPVAQAGLDALQPLWLQLHMHHQSVAPELRPFVDPLTSWSARRALYIHSLETGGAVFLARSGDKDVGYLVTAWERSPWPATLVSPQTVAELVTIHVDPEWRGQGVGSRLLQTFEAELHRAGVQDCFLGAIPGNTRAMDLYQRRGFRPTSFLMMRFGRELPSGADGSEAVGIDAVSTSEVNGLRDVWLAAHRRCQFAAPALGQFVSDDVSWELSRNVLLDAAAAGRLFRAGTRDRPVGLAYVAMTNSAVLWDTWVTRPSVAEITLVSASGRNQPAGVTLTMLQFVEQTLARLDITDHIVNVMSSDTETIEVCRARGFLPGWLTLNRFTGVRSSSGT